MKIMKKPPPRGRPRKPESACRRASLSLRLSDREKSLLIAGAARRETTVIDYLLQLAEADAAK